MLVAGFDLETTGLNTQTDHILQVGAVLWDTEAKHKKVKIKYDALIYGSHTPLEIDPKITQINGITREDLVLYGRPLEKVFGRLHEIFNYASAIAAHNGTLFDKLIYEATCQRHAIPFPDPRLWIDTSCDVDYPAEISTRRLSYLATDHGFLNPFPHDATSDVLTMLKIADKYDWNKIVEWAKAPTFTIRADSTFQQKELVKKQNYRWNNDQKIWIKSIKDFQLKDAQTAAKEAGFNVTVISNQGAK